jgi:multicomponent K+:H+ antiporter subunit E
MIALTKLVPAPLLSALLVAVWLTLARAISLGTVLLAIVLGLAIPLMTTSLRATDTRVRRPLVAARFILKVGYDVLASSIDVAWSLVSWRWHRPKARFVIIPLDLRDPLGLAALAMVTTVVPGTVWSEIALDRSALMLHAWNVDDEQAFIARYKARYERPLQEMFE